MRGYDTIVKPTLITITTVISIVFIVYQTFTCISFSGRLYCAGLSLHLVPIHVLFERNSFSSMAGYNIIQASQSSRLHCRLMMGIMRTLGSTSRIGALDWPRRWVPNTVWGRLTSSFSGDRCRRIDGAFGGATSP